MHIKSDNSDPSGDANPIGNSEFLYIADIKYATGIRTSKIEIMLWINDISDLSSAQKYPLKANVAPAKAQSQT